MTELHPCGLPQKLIPNIDRWVAKYPVDQKQSAIIPVLLLVQEQHRGWLPRHIIDAVADYLEMPRIAAYEVATFYSMFELQPVGKYKLELCTNVSCSLSGAVELLQHIEQRLGIKVGETTPDGKFTLREVECLGACVNGVALQIGHTYHEGMTPEKFDNLLAELD